MKARRDGGGTVDVKVDSEDMKLLGAKRWRVKPNGYVYARERGTSMYLHRVITGAVRGQDVDHVNGDRLDNRRGNLRVCSRRQNCQAFQKPRVNKTSRFRGVSRDSDRGVWTAFIRIEGRSTYLGRFESEMGAALAYDEAARKHFGIFASPNFPDEVKT